MLAWGNELHLHRSNCFLGVQLTLFCANSHSLARSKSQRNRYLQEIAERFVAEGIEVPLMSLEYWLKKIILGFYQFPSELHQIVYI